MREAAVPGYRLSRSKRSTRILTTLGLIGLLIGLLTSVGITLEKTGLSPYHVSRYYRGDEGADALDALMVASQARPLGELLEVTHLHVMGGSILLFLLCHLLSVCDVKDSTRTFLYLVSFISFITTFTLPWLIVYVSGNFSYLFGPSVIILLISLIILTVVPLFEMWAPRKRRA